MIDFFDLRRSHDALRNEFHEVLDRVIDSSEYVLGSTVAEFEAAFAQFCQSRYCIGTNSGTSALHLALEACGVSAGDEVITTPMTFIATSAAISYLGAIPVFVDVDPLSWNLDPNKIEAAITPVSHQSNSFSYFFTVSYYSAGFTQCAEIFSRIKAITAYVAITT